ncbi:MAG: intracellular growth attenuator family protein [Bacteroidales bacterium]|nr:intracellular growth attenuator family protein [Bacteroidales bacterium]MDE6257540.1 hypothetical protein [Muribaculaceae bacterium]
MKTLSIIAYAVGFVLLLISCFTTGVALTWWMGGLAVLFLIVGCIFQFNSMRRNGSYYHRYH